MIHKHILEHLNFKLIIVLLQFEAINRKKFHFAHDLNNNSINLTKQYMKSKMCYFLNKFLPVGCNRTKKFAQFSFITN